MNNAPLQADHDAAEFARWLDDFFAAYYRHRPVNATFIGVHDYDECLPDYSEAGLAATVSDMRSLKQRASAISASALTRTQQVDKRLCEGYLELQFWEFEQDHGVRANPCLYTGEAIFGVMSLLLTDFAPLDERMRCATARLNAIPELLRQGQENIRQAPAAWAALAATECKAAVRFLGNAGLHFPGARAPQEYHRGVERAARAFDEFGAWLKSDLASAPESRYGCGEEALAMHLQQAHCLEQDAAAIVSHAQAEMATATNYLDVHLADFSAEDRDAVLDGLGDIHPETDAYYRRYQETWDDMRRLAERKNLLTWPEFPIHYVPQPAWARDVVADLYFLYYRSPAAFKRPPAHDYLVTPIDDSMPEQERLQRLRANNDGAIKLNHVVHHGGIGHHVQNWHAFRSSSRVGQMAAVDCASRIAMNCGATMAEGWACYATDLMAEAGGLTDREMYAEQHTRTRMCARAIVDMQLHRQQMTFAESIEFYRKSTGMGREAATYEATRNSMFPASAVIYVAGCDAIHDLRKTLRELKGSRFNLRDFHDRFLSYGSIPVALVAAEMLADTNRNGTVGTSE